MVRDSLSVARPGELLGRWIHEELPHRAGRQVQQPRAVAEQLKQDLTAVGRDGRSAYEPSALRRPVDPPRATGEIEHDEPILMAVGDPPAIGEPGATPGLAIGIGGQATQAAGLKREVPQIPDRPRLGSPLTNTSDCESGDQLGTAA